MRGRGAGLRGLPLLRALRFMILQQRLAGAVLLLQCLQQRLRTRVQMLAGGDQRLLLTFDQRSIQGLLLFGGSTQGLRIVLCIGLQALADTCDQRFGMRGLAIAEGLQVLAQVAHQCLLCLGLFTHHLGPAGLGCDAAALETVAQAGQLLLHGLLDAGMQCFAVMGQAS
ncbi:hypothetical protein SM139_0842 [Stenotrophomonas maltophilia]|nr:hypothetical protein SM139_0842 [Stenotrophomonas maltophilia]